MAGRPVMGGTVQGLPIVHMELVKPGPKMKFVFKMFKENGSNTPLLIPHIDNPSKVPVPGIIQLIKGDLGITEKIFSPILKPILPFFENPVKPVENGSNKEGSYNFGTLTNLNARQKDYADSVLGGSVGFKSLEKSTIQGMMESLKPLIEIALILIELLAVIEDAICRFSATAIKIPIKGWIGFPSRNPKYTFGSLNSNLQHFRKALQDGVKAFNTGSSYNSIASNVPGGNAEPADTNQDPDSRDSIYLAYFDEEGNIVEPPAWVKNSGKWGFASDQPVISTTTGDNPAKLGFPFLSDDTKTGVNQLYKYHANLLNKTPELIQQSNKNLQNIESSGPLKYVNEEKILQALGSDFNPGEHINEINSQVDEFKNEIVNSVREFILTEYVNKHLNSQLKNKYVEKESTGQIFENKNLGEDVNPEDRNSIRIEYPVFNTSVVLTGDQKPSNLSSEIYSVPKGRISKSLVPYKDDFRLRNDDGNYVEIRKKFDAKIYFEKVNLVDNFQEVNSLEAFFNTNETPVNVPKDKVIVPENVSKYRNNKIPGKVLSYFLPLEWEVISEYEVRKTLLKKDASGNVSKETVVVGTEIETVQNRIEPEANYDIRIIQVINLPIIPDGSVENLTAAFPKPNHIAVFRDIPNSNEGKYIQIAELGSEEPLIVYAEITTQSPLDLIGLIQQPTSTFVSTAVSSTVKLYDNKDHSKIQRYINSETFKTDSYLYLRYANTKFSKEALNKDNGEFYRIKNLKENWKNVKLESNFNSKMSKQSGIFNSKEVLTETKTDESELFIFDGDKQSLKIHKSKNSIPTYILESQQAQINILSGSINKGKFYVSKIDVSNNYVIFKFDPEKSDKKIVSEKVVANYYYKERGNAFELKWNQVILSIDFLDSTEIEIDGTMNQYTGGLELYPVKNISVIDDIFKQKGNAIYLDGVNSELNFRNQTNKAAAVKKALTYLEDLDKMIDGIYKVNGIKTIKTSKGINISVIDLDPKFAVNITDRTAFTTNAKLSWYKPFRIAEAPTTSDIDGTIDQKNYNKEIGTAFYNDKFVAPSFRIPKKYKGNNYEHIVPVINKGNGRGEGIVFHGLDPRFVDRTKWKVFWLVEAIKKDISPDIFGDPKLREPENIENAKPSWQLPHPDSTPDSDPNGKEWYGLIHKLTVIPYLISKVGQIGFGKLIPAIKKLIKLISNPAKITDLLLEIVRLKMAQNMEFFDDTYTRKLVTDLQDALNSDSGVSKYFFAGKVSNPNMPQSASYILDGLGVVKFGACLGLNFPFGVKINALTQGGNKRPTFNSSWFEAIVSDDRTAAEKDKSIYQTKRDQPIIKLILNIIKMPFEVLFMIAKWLMCWIKKVTNPTKLIPAVIELLSFKWLLCIINPMTMVKIIGASKKACNCGCNSDGGELSQEMLALLGDFDKNGDTIAKSAGPDQELIDDLIKDIAGLGQAELVEVLVYNIYRNGVFVRSEEETIPYQPYGYTGPANLTDSNGINNGVNLNNLIGSNNDVSGNNTGNNTSNDNAGCGPKIFDLSGLISLPFVSDMPLLNKCELIQLFLKPLEMILGILRTIQEFINAFISMPVSILGLEPTLTVPRLEIINAIEKKIETLKTRLSQTTPRNLVG